MALLYQETVQPGAAGYAPGSALVAACDSRMVARGWRLGNRIVSVQLHKSLGGGMWKNSDRFILSDPPADLAKLEAAGVHHPSSWGDCFHQLAPKSKPLPWTFNGMLAWWPGGPWSQATKKGKHSGQWFRYDLQGAYRWAATWGLPDTSTYRVVTKAGSNPGVFVATLRESRPDLPPVFQEQGATVVVSHEEIERYNLACDIVRGVSWSAEHPRDYVEQTLKRLPFPKDVGRAYWGRWIARDPLTCWTPNAEWSLRNIAANFVWGWLIVGRVRLRVWEVAQEAAHVYVDEVLIPHELPTGGEGEWKLKQTYPDGVVVHRTGYYADARTAIPTMQTGVPHHA